jgi:cAMP-dependent protein kinase regulator
MPTVADAKAHARRAHAENDLGRALWIWGRIAEKFPQDHQARLKVADVLLAMGRPDQAAPVYQAAIPFAARSGHPLAAIVACRGLEGVADTAGLLSGVASLYCATSGSLGKRASRMSVDLGGGLKDADLAPKGAPEAIAETASLAARKVDGLKFPDALVRIPLLSSLTEDGFVKAAQAARVARLRDGHVVFREGDEGHSLYLVADGDVRVVKGDDREVGRLGEGAVFGEMALLGSSRRSASVQVVGEADLLEIDRGMVEAIDAQVPGVGSALAMLKRERLLQDVMHAALFQPFPPEQRHELLARFKGLEVDTGTVIIRQGEAGRGLYVLAGGEMEIVREQADGVDVVLAYVGPGGMLGEIALLRDRPATATVRAAKPSTLLFMPGEMFRRLVDGVPELRDYFDKLTDERLREVNLLERGEFVDITFEE